MTRPALPPVSIDRVKNTLADAIRSSVTESHRELHGKALQQVVAMEKDLFVLEAAIAELEAEYDEQDASYARRRERRVATFGADSMLVSGLDGSHGVLQAGRLQARDIASQVVAQMDLAFDRFLNGGIGLEEFTAAARLTLGTFAGAEPASVFLQILERLRKSIDRLDVEREQSEQYALKVEIFAMLAGGFASLFRRLNQRVGDALSTVL